MKLICIVAPEFGGPEESDRLGSHWHNLAIALSEQDFEVTVLLTGFPETGKSPVSQAILEDAGITVCTVSDLAEPSFQVAGGDRYTIRSAAVHRFLSSRHFDVVHFQEWQANGFIPIQAKRTGLAYADTLLCVTMNSSSEWRRDSLDQWPTDPIQEAKLDYTERYCCQHADFLVSPSQAMFDWGLAHHWTLAEHRAVLPFCFDAQPHDAWFQLTRQPALQPPEPAIAQPLVSICVAYYNYGQHLEGLIASLKAQSYPHLEVILVDDGSTDPRSFRAFEQAARDLPAPAWTFIRQDNAGPGAARNHAARVARGDYIIFVDADNLPRPEMVETFIAGIRSAAVDCLSCHFEAFLDGHFPTEAHRPIYAYTPIGPSLEVGIAENCFGDTNFCIKRSAFSALGGFTEQRGTATEDWEFLSLLVLRGYRMDVIPQALLWYRFEAGSLSRRTPVMRNHMAAMRAYQGGLPPDMVRIVSALAAPLAYQLNEGNERLNRLNFQIRKLEARLGRPLFDGLRRRLADTPKVKRHVIQALRQAVQLLSFGRSK